MRRLIRRITILVIGSTLILSFVGVASAALNPGGTGQPSVECGDENATELPHGFTTSGFEHAETVYAGSEGSASAVHAASDHAVSQYDVACYQLTARH